MNLDEILPKPVRDALRACRLVVTDQYKDRYGAVYVIDYLLSDDSPAPPSRYLFLRFYEGNPLIDMAITRVEPGGIVSEVLTQHDPNSPDLPEFIVQYFTWPHAVNP